MKLLFCLMPFLFAAAAAADVPEWEPGVSIPVNLPDVEEQLTWAAEAGFVWLEADMTPMGIGEGAVEKVRAYKQAADRAGLKIWSVHIPFGRSWDPSEADPQKRREGLAKIINAMDIAREFGPYRMAVIHPSFEPIDDAQRAAKMKALKDSLDKLGPLFREKYGVRLALECLPRTCLVNSSEEALEVLKNRPEIVNCFDTNHLLKEKPEEYAKAVGPLIKTIHVSDYDALNERHWIPGKGIIDWPAVVRALQEAGYDGPFMFEVTTTPWKDDMRQFYADLMASWETIKKSL